MRKASLASIFISAALVLLLTLGAWAHQPGGHGMQHGGKQPFGGAGYGMGPGMMGHGGGAYGMMEPGMMHCGMGHSMGRGMMDPGFGRHGNVAYLQEALDLSEDQMNSIFSIHTEAKKDTIKRVAEIKIQHLELRDMLRVSKVNMSAVKEKLAKIEKLRTDLKLARIEKHEKVKSILTTEQLEKFSKMNPWFMGGGSSHMEDSD